jgi:hypothetical protein
MKNFKTSLHIFIAFVSMLGFLGGWATLAHSRKPIQPAQFQANVLEALPPLDPIPAFNSVSSNNNGGFLGSFMPSRRNNAMMPMFMTRGS